MIVFTLTNQVTDDVWVGTTRESSAERFESYKEALYHGIKHRFYKDLRDFGVENFVLDDYAVAEDREELKELFDEAMDTYEGKSLIGVKTVKTSILDSKAPAPKKVATRKTASGNDDKADATISKAAAAISKARTGASATMPTTTKLGANGRPVAKKVVKEKLASGRTGNAKREKAIKEAIMAEKAEREAEKAKKAMEEADAMKAILARLDSRGSTLKKR